MANTATDPTRRTHWPLVVAATVAGMAIAMQIAKVAAGLPLIRAEFGAGLTQLAVYVTLISLVAATVGLGFGTITRRIGALRAGVIGLMLVSAGSALGALAHGLPVLLVSRVFESLGFALTVTAMPAVIQAATRAKDRMLALGLWATWLPLGIAVLMVISWLFLDRIGWRGLFWVTAIVPAASALAMLASARGQNPVPRQPGRLGLGGLLRRDVVLTTLNFIAFSSSNQVVIAFLPTILVDMFGLAPSEAAAVSFAGAVVLVISNLMTGWLLHRGAGIRPLYILAFIGMIFGSALLFAPQIGLVSSIAGVMVFSLCAGVPPALAWASIPILAKSDGEVPLLSGLFFQGAGIGQIMGPMLAGYLADGPQGWVRAVWIVAGLAGGGVFLSLGLSRRLSHADSAKTASV